ncbi:MAG TPA: FAD-binding oxidoreductase, partial [Longimicrobiales bacterium]|nr:FAD-binding oxidoreductase [Longimicrobiales bacterium]
MTEPLPAALVRRLQELVGEDHVVTDPARLLVYESDGLTAYRWPPRAVVLPADTEEVAGVLRALHAEGIPVVPRGAGTGLSGGALAAPGAVIVGTARMSKILSIDAEN